MQIITSRSQVNLKRRSVASVLAFMFLFAALYTAGVGFFLFVNGQVQFVGQANANQARASQQASLEKLGVAAHLNRTGYLFLSINNTGGISSTILDVYVACNRNCGGPLQGQVISKDPVTGQQFLTSSGPSGALNVTLPITLPIGTSTKYLKSCGKPGIVGCNIGIVKGFTFNKGTGEVVVASVLTADGNVFSAQYPPPPLPSTVNMVIENNSTVNKVQESGGGPLIAMQIVASPPVVFSCTWSNTTTCVTATVFVYNYATITMTGVTVNLNPPSVTGTASLSVSSPCQPTPQNISAGSVGVFKCLYNAAVGTEGGGFGSFSGTATGFLNGKPVTSAEANSNPIQIGQNVNTSGQGAFTGNFFILKYSSCVQNLTGTYPFFVNDTSHSLVEGQASNTTSFSATSAKNESLPTGVAVDSSGNLWVADYNNNRVLEYFGPRFGTGEAASVVIGQGGFATRTAATSQTGLNGPVAIAFDSAGNLWVVDSGNNRVLEYTQPFSNGEAAALVLGQSSFIVGTPNTGGISASSLDNPHGITFDSSGNLWVSDFGNNRILEYVPSFSTHEAASLVLGQASFATGGLPPGVLAYVDITLTNTQASATPVNFPQQLTVNWNAYSSYLAANVQNVGFFDSGWNPLYAWCESSCSNSASASTVWVNLGSNTIAGSGGTQTIMMAFYSTGANQYSTSGYWGAYPTFTGTYGQYDNGQKVFTFYDNFIGTTLDSNWQAPKATAGGSVTVNNGATFSTKGSSDYVFLPAAATVTYPQVTEMLFDPAGTATKGIAPEIGESTGVGVSNWVDLCPGYGWNWFTGSANTGYFVPEPASCQYGSYKSGLTENIQGNNVVGIAWVANGNEKVFVNYVNIYSSADNSVAIANYYPYVGISNYQAGSFQTSWVRDRAYPPNGVMPSASFGGVNGVSTTRTSLNGPGG